MRLTIQQHDKWVTEVSGMDVRYYSCFIEHIRNGFSYWHNQSKTSLFIIPQDMVKTTTRYPRECMRF